MSTLSVIVITLNEEKNIDRCLESVEWANEVIVLDSGSVDKTCEISKSYSNVRVYSQDWLGFGAQKNKALSYTTKDWVLWLDADEVLSAELTIEIKKQLEKPSAECFKFKRQSYFLGKLIKHGDWGRDYVTRLFRKGVAEFTNDAIHERLEISKDQVSLMPGMLFHYTQDSISISLKKCNTYSDQTSLRLFQKGKKSGLLKAVFHKHWTFFRCYFMRLGFLDGGRGYMIAKLSAYGSFFKYVKLWEKG
ncbi:glycosyltransferase family 2 protein [Francisellaceae bacterium]|nr:glycosyltransferase family 2 protein [Francisellaceae bacterium]